MSLPTSLASLVAALQGEGETPVPPAAWERVARRFLAPDEIVLLALRGNGFTWWEPLLLVTDRRVLHLRQGAFLPCRLIRELPAQEIAGAEFRQRSIGWGPVIVRPHRGRRIWIRSNGDAPAQRFVDGLNGLLPGRRWVDRGAKAP